MNVLSEFYSLSFKLVTDKGKTIFVKILGLLKTVLNCKSSKVTTKELFREAYRFDTTTRRFPTLGTRVRLQQLQQRVLAQHHRWIDGYVWSVLRRHGEAPDTQTSTRAHPVRRFS